MLMQKLLWMKESENLDAEIRECTDEGRKIDDLIPQALSVKAMPDGVEKEERAAALMLEMERRPLIPGFPYQNPTATVRSRRRLPDRQGRLGFHPHIGGRRSLAHGLDAQSAAHLEFL